MQDIIHFQTTDDPFVEQALLTLRRMKNSTVNHVAVWSYQIMLSTGAKNFDRRGVTYCILDPNS